MNGLATSRSIAAHSGEDDSEDRPSEDVHGGSEQGIHGGARRVFRRILVRSNDDTTQFFVEHHVLSPGRDVGDPGLQLVAGFTLGVSNKLLEPFTGAVLAKILVLVFIVLFIQRRPRGLFPPQGRSAEA